MLPAKADPDQQKEFLEREIQPRLDEAREGKEWSVSWMRRILC